MSENTENTEVLQQENTGTVLQFPDNDPNIGLKQMIESRKNKKQQEDQTEGAEKKEDSEKTTEEAPKKDVSSAIADALGFRKPKEKKEQSDKKQEKSEKQEDKKADKKDDQQEASKKKEETAVIKKRQQQQIDPVKIAAETAAAVVRETVKASKIEAKQPEEPDYPPEISNEADRKTYDLVKFMSETNPKFKNGPKIVVEHARKVRAYADRWESSNPGRIYNPNDPEHNEFYDRLQTPWTDDDLLEARLDMREAKRDAERKKAEAPEIEKKKVESALEELAPEVEKITIGAAGAIAKAVSDEVLDTIVKKGWADFAKEDSTTAEVLSRTLNTITPMIQAIVQLDDPKLRVKYDSKNPDHQDWAKFLNEKEESLYGQKNQAGKTLVTRDEFSKMSQFQRAKHWYLKRDDLLLELIKDASEIVKNDIAAEKEFLEKRIASLGYVKKEQPKDKDSASQSTKSKEQTVDKKQKQAEQIESPSAGGGAKIDAKGGGGTNGLSGFLNETSSILFRRQ